MAPQIILNTHFADDEILYDGSQLRSHYIYETFGVGGDAILSFIGPCDVKVASMVDLEDVRNNKTIFSHKMVHFIVEHFDDDLTRMVLKQRLLISLIQEELYDSLDEVKIQRRGDDLFVEHFKLSVSIATASPVSTLIHVGFNIESHDTPVPTRGLKDFGLNPHAFARSVMNRYVAEMTGVTWAKAKVRPVA
ncbi:MAG: hypothetical protein ACD_73C00723G0004 [uncultured bacterium]|nr:MAG: hypothetical protein ACD_73C00723G0004 [uncultured bacterium]